MSNLNPPPQFGTAQYAEQPAQNCKICGSSISGPYYRVNGSTACSACADRAHQGPATPADAAFPRALLFGIVGAAIGLALYAGFTIITNIEIGYVSLAVGFIVAKAMLMGSNGIGGRKYQIAAALLTYAAVSLSFIPIFFYASHIPLSNAPWGKLIQLGLMAPFLELQSDTFRGFIGLVILYVGINIAWKMMKGKPTAVVEGPF